MVLKNLSGCLRVICNMIESTEWFLNSMEIVSKSEEKLLVKFLFRKRERVSNLPIAFQWQTLEFYRELKDLDLIVWDVPYVLVFDKNLTCQDFYLQQNYIKMQED